MERIHKSMLVETSNQMRTKYLADEQAALLPVKNTIESMLSKFNLLHFEVDVSRADRRRVELRVYCNSDSDFSSTDLTWWYNVWFDPRNGDVSRSTRFKSNIHDYAHTQIDMLKQAVKAFETLNSIDYSDLLDVEFPNWDDYSSEE